MGRLSPPREQMVSAIFNKRIMKRLFLLVAVLALSLPQSSCLGLKVKESALATSILGTWQVRNIETQGRAIDLEQYADVVIRFSRKFEETDDGKKELNYEYYIDLSGREFTFYYEVIEAEEDQDFVGTIKFVKVKGWEPMRVVSITKDLLVADQVIDNRLIRWNLEPYKKN